MIDRLIAGAVAAMFAVAAAPAAPAAAADDDLWPYAESCVTVTLDGMRGVYRPDSTWWEPWYDATVRGRSVPCRGARAATLAVTQYHVRDGAPVGLMSAPWSAAGSTSFSRFGRIEPDVAALCVSTGLARRDADVVARHAACVRPVRRGADHLVTRFAPVPLTDPLVAAPLAKYPAAGTAPGAPRCTVDCLVSPYITWPPAGPPALTPDTPTDGATTALQPYESPCHTVSITDTFAGPSDDEVNGYDVWLTGAVDTCKPDASPPTVRTVRYWPDRGVVMKPWDLSQFPVLSKGAQVNENTGALCVTSGIRESGGRLYGVHDLCWRVDEAAPDAYRLVAIATDDPRVGKPLVSNIRPDDPRYPPNVCATCM